MNRLKRVKSAALILAALLLLSACGTEKAVKVENYGDTGVSTSDVENDEKAEKDDSVEEGDSTTLVEKLGGSELRAEKTFSIGGRSASLKVNYAVQDTDYLPAYKVSPASPDVRESEIVANFLGDSAVAINSDSRKYLNEDLGDSHNIIRSCQSIAYYHQSNVNWMKLTHPAWTEEDTFYIHTYEGLYNGIDYQMMVSYSKLFKQLYVSLFPKKLSDLTGNPDVDDVEMSSADGNLYVYFRRQLTVYNLENDLGSIPNKCTLDETAVKETAVNALKEKLYMDFPLDVVSLYDTSAITMDSSVEPVSSELIFYNWDSFSEGNLDTLDRNGYAAYLMLNICNQDIVLSGEINRSVEEAEDLVSGGIYINDSGVLGFNITEAYNFDELITDNVNILSFEDAMNKFVESADQNIKTSEIEDKKSPINFEKIRFAYYPVPTDNAEEFMFIPVWILEAENDKKVTMVRAIINATDGSFVEAFY